MKDFFEFKKFITPAFIKDVFVVSIVGILFLGAFDIKAGLDAIDFGGAALIFSGLLKIFSGPIIVRVVCEIVLVLFKINDNLNELRREQKGNE